MFVCTSIAQASPYNLKDAKMSPGLLQLHGDLKGLLWYAGLVMEHSRIL